MYAEVVKRLEVDTVAWLKLMGLGIPSGDAWLKHTCGSTGQGGLSLKLILG